MPTIPAALIHVSASIKGDPMIAELNAKVVGIAAKLKAKAVAADTAKMAPAAAPSGTQSVAERLATYSQGTVAAAEEEGYDPKNESTPFPGNGRAPERARGRDDRAPQPKPTTLCGGIRKLFQRPDSSDIEHSALQRIYEQRGREASLDELLRIRAILQN
ncbi:hypothetical protein QTN93_15180 [Sphingomonas aerolata]|uniref:hypothetical protein n=1 Tax=Sphingomonas aerolata TaxID=185951 RepID=UPI0035A7313E